MTQDNSWLLPIKELEPAHDGIWFHGQGNWGSIGINTLQILVERMQFIHDKKQNGDLNLNKAGIETAQKFSWKRTASTIVEHLS